MKKLLNEGIVVQEKEGERKGYHVQDPRNVIRILVTYRPLFDKLADAFTDLWVEIYR
jgi:hypothetical protein